MDDMACVPIETGMGPMCAEVYGGHRAESCASCTTREAAGLAQPASESLIVQQPVL